MSFRRSDQTSISFSEDEERLYITLNTMRRVEVASRLICTDPVGIVFPSLLCHCAALLQISEIKWLLMVLGQCNIEWQSQMVLLFSTSDSDLFESVLTFGFRFCSQPQFHK